MTSQCANDPSTLLGQLHTLHGKVQDLTVYAPMEMRDHPFMVDPAYRDTFHVTCNFMLGSNRRSYQKRITSFYPGHLHSGAARFLDVNGLNVFIAAATPMDRHGYMLISLCQIHEWECLRRADRVILEVNPNLPRVYGDTEIHISQVDRIIEVDTALPELPKSEPSKVDMQIGRYIAELVRDGDTIQLGIGSLPDATAMALMDKRDLGLHTELMTNSILDMVEAGVITNRKKTLHPGKLVATFAYGTRKLYDMLDENPSVLMLRGSYVNDPVVIARNDNFVSINTALSVDLMGQVASEAIGPKQYSGTGGQADTAIGAGHSRGGRSIIALPSTKKNGTISSITALLPAGSIVTLSRNDVDYVVTEYGIAPLKGRCIRQRVENLISIAHPDFRGELRAAARDVLW